MEANARIKAAPADLVRAMYPMPAAVLKPVRPHAEAEVGNTALGPAPVLAKAGMYGAAALAY